jgi:uncharacterized membrane protein
MRKQEFMRSLENLLQDIPNKEREEALNYYLDYLEDAGEENEEAAIKELGSPERVASIIKSDLNGDAFSSKSEFTENGYKNSFFDDSKNEIVKKQYEIEKMKQAERSRNEERNASGSYKTNEHYDSNRDANGNYQNGGFDRNQSNQRKEPEYVYEYAKIPKALIIIAIIFFIPVGIPLICAGFGVFIAMVAVIFSLVVGFGATAAALTFSGVVVFIFGITKLVIYPMAAMLFCGGGLLVFGLGLLFAVLTGICARLMPLVFRFTISVIKLPFRRREATA